MESFLNLTITGFGEMEMLAGTPFTQVISIHDAHVEEQGGFEDTLRGYFPRARRLLSYFDDVDTATERGPLLDEIERLLAFSRSFGPGDRILIHCRAGISRSTALAYAVLCQHSEPGVEGEALAHLEKLRPQLYPNALVVKLADGLLGRKGRMVRELKTLRGRWKGMGLYSGPA